MDAAFCVVWVFTGTGVKELWNRDNSAHSPNSRRRVSLCHSWLRHSQFHLPFLSYMDGTRTFFCQFLRLCEWRNNARGTRKGRPGVDAWSVRCCNFLPNQTSSWPRVIFISAPVYDSECTNDVIVKTDTTAGNFSSRSFLFKGGL